MIHHWFQNIGTIQSINFIGLLVQDGTWHSVAVILHGCFSIMNENMRCSSHGTGVAAFVCAVVEFANPLWCHGRHSQSLDGEALQDFLVCVRRGAFRRNPVGGVSWGAVGKAAASPPQAHTHTYTRRRLHTLAQQPVAGLRSRRLGGWRRVNKQLVCLSSCLFSLLSPCLVHWTGAHPLSHVQHCKPPHRVSYRSTVTRDVCNVAHIGKK